jgi:hypothetical protein
MAFSIFSNNLGGVNTFLGSVKGPLSSLTNNSTPENLVYPSDLSSNPAMCHAVQFSIYDYTSGFQDIQKKAIASVAEGLTNLSGKSLSDITSAFSRPEITETEINDLTGESITFNRPATNGEIGGIATAKTENQFNKAAKFGKEVLLPNAVALGSAPTYRPKRKSSPLANISLYMPDTLSISHDAEYGQISMTEVFGPLGTVAQGFTDVTGRPATEYRNTLTDNPFAKAATANLFGFAAGKIPGVNGSALAEAAKGALGIATNPQIQLLYRGIDLRSFSLSFVFTPKSSQEAQTAKDIIDTFTYYSVPGLASAAIDNNPGQYLTPPQLFTVKFVFLGNSGIAGSIGNIFSSALNNLGLSSLTSNPTSTITSGREAKIMNIQECVLTGVTVDYAPNGWAAYNDGYPVQTTLQLNFKETQILTKDRLPNRKIAENYETQTNREINRDFIKNGSGVSDAVALAGLDESAAFGNQSMSISAGDREDAELGAALTALSAEQQADFVQEYGDQVSVFVDSETGEITPLPL